MLDEVENFYKDSYIEDDKKDPKMKSVAGIQLTLELKQRGTEGKKKRAIVRFLNDKKKDHNTSTVSNGITTTRYAKLVQTPMKDEDDFVGVIVESCIDNKLIYDRGLTNFDRN